MGFCGLLQRKRFAMTKKIKALRNDFSFSVTARSDNDEGNHKTKCHPFLMRHSSSKSRDLIKKNKKALLVASKCDIMKDILRTKKGGYPHVKTEC